MTNKKIISAEREKEVRAEMRDRVSLLFSLSAIIISVISFFYGMTYNHVRDNMNSYFEPFNYHIDIIMDGYIPKVKKSKAGLEINTPKISIVPDTGGFRNISIIFFTDNQFYSIYSLNLTDNLDHKKRNATDLMSTIESFTPQIIKRHESSDEAKKNGFKESYFTTIFIVVEDYNKNYYVTPINFEYPINGDGSLAEGALYKILSEIDLLYTTGDKSSNSLSTFEESVLKDYRDLIDALRTEGLQVHSI